jgi:hypothetical protein
MQKFAQLDNHFTKRVREKSPKYPEMLLISDDWTGWTVVRFAF